MADSIEVYLSKQVYAPTVQRIVARYEFSLVVLWLDGTKVEMTTPVASKIGLALAMGYTTAEPGDLVIMRVNGTEVQLVPLQARQLGGVVLKKADRADDWQRQLPSGG